MAWSTKLSHIGLPSYFVFSGRPWNLHKARAARSILVIACPDRPEAIPGKPIRANYLLPDRYLLNSSHHTVPTVLARPARLDTRRAVGCSLNVPAGQ